MSTVPRQFGSDDSKFYSMILKGKSPWALDESYMYYKNHVGGLLSSRPSKRLVRRNSV